MFIRNIFVVLTLGAISIASTAEPTQRVTEVEPVSAVQYARQQPVLTLEAAIERTLAENAQLYQFRFRQRSITAERQMAAFSPPTELALEVENFAGSGSFSNTDSAETTLALSSVIELGGKARSRTALIDAKSDRLKYERQAATLDVLGALTTLYIRCLSTKEGIQLAEEGVVLAKQMISTVEQRVSKGAAPEAELLRARAALAGSNLRLEALRRKFSAQKVSLASYWGQTKPNFAELEGSLSEFDSSDSFASLYRRAQGSPSIAIFASEARLKDAEVELARAQSRVDIGWQLGIRQFEEANDTALVAGVSIPLFASKRNRPAVAAARAERNAVEYQQTDALLKLHGRLFNAFSQREANIYAVEEIRTNVLPVLQQGLHLTKEAYENGRYRYQDWISAQQDLLAAKRHLIEAATAAQISHAIIEQLIAEPLRDRTLTN